ncbi:MAG: Flp pilus assembly protein CpaB [Rhodospirillales bacterium]|nr:Flp pilus assembly protein CpaB [Rhodospirillales bacterium]MCB9994986.1 Flp pilus assembly protein CpaB [Rhodospirillales bacterium]
MNRNVMIVLAGGFLIAVLVALLVQASLSGGKSAEPVAVAEVPKVQIVVAAKDLSIGTELSDENMKWQDWPKDAVFPGAVAREDDKQVSEMISGRLRRVIKAGEPIVESALVPETEGNFLAASLAPDMRAFAIDVKAATAVGGFVGPGDYVDVLLTYRQNIRYRGENSDAVQNMIEMNIDDMATETILQNVKVLAVDQTAMRDEEEGGVKVGKTVTLEVNYQGAEVLALATKYGDLSLALRRLGDEKIITEKPPVTTDARLTNIYDEVMKEISQTSGQDYSGQSSKVVRIYRGGGVEEISVRP